ncbi:MAG TPA: hypothetical protein VFJ07_04365 [Streptosporangiaceae bacterium]|jgi:hypothetical protein|nr:hypothetical protein [Streptosporangiaceae bacterium]
MGRRRLVSAAATGICVLALGLGLNGSASASPAGRFSVRTVVLNCLGHPQVRPGRFTLACADANDYLTGLAWTSWGPKLASATGVQALNDCVPYCAAGHFHRYPVDVVLWHPAAAGPGSQRYTSITLLYPGAHPAYVGSRRPVTTSMTLPR